MANNSGSAGSKQAKDANDFVVQSVFMPIDSRHVAINSGFATVCTQIATLGVDSQIGVIRFVEITGTTNFHYKAATAKALVSGALLAAGEGAFCPALVPKIIAIGDNSFIGARAAVGTTAGVLHITLLL